MSLQLGAKDFLRHIEGLRSKKVHIQKLRFPNYRNIRSGEELTFRFPITVLLGRNGTNKSSILLALYGALKGRSIGEFWFETALDAIPDTDSAGRKQSVAHTYQSKSGAVVECLKARAPRGSADPDYWEAVKPSKVYGFPAGATRKPPISIPMVRLDFRQVLPAFDKYFYFPDERHIARLDRYAKEHRKLRRNYRPQDYLRNRASVVKHKLDTEGVAFSADTLEVASYVLGQTYIAGKVLKHDVYWGHQGTTIILSTKNFGDGYSDAFAGSGESAALALIHAVENVEKGSLILLDEPETSLHPLAQQRMLHYLVHQALTKDLQFVVATHSQFFGEALPNEAVRLLRQDSDGRIAILDGLSVKEALHDIAELPRGKTIFVEDVRAQAVVLAALKSDVSSNLSREFEVTVRTGGVSRILADIQAYGASDKGRILIVLDGDQKPNDPLPLEKDWPGGVAALKALIGKCIRGNNQSGQALSFVNAEDCIQYLRFVSSNVTYLPRATPEELVWDISTVKEIALEYGFGPKVAEIGDEPDFKERIRRVAELVAGFKVETVFDLLLAKFLKSDVPDARWIKNELVEWIRKHA